MYRTNAKPETQKAAPQRPKLGTFGRIFHEHDWELVVIDKDVRRARNQFLAKHGLRPPFVKLRQWDGDRMLSVWHGGGNYNTFYNNGSISISDSGNVFQPQALVDFWNLYVEVNIGVHCKTCDLTVKTAGEPYHQPSELPKYTTSLNKFLVNRNGIWRRMAEDIEHPSDDDAPTDYNVRNVFKKLRERVGDIGKATPFILKRFEIL